MYINFIEKKFSHYASHLGTYGFYADGIYKTFMDKVIHLRKLTRSKNRSSSDALASSSR